MRETMVRRLKGAYFGWYTVLAGAIIACWGYGSLYYGMSALFLPLITEYGWTRAQLSAAFSMQSIEGGLEGPFGGMLIDRYGPRIVTVIATIIASLGLILVLFVKDILQFVIIWGFVVSLGYNLGLYDTIYAAVAKWFVRKRTFALAVVTVGGGLGGPVVVPIMTWMIIVFGWRLALVFVAVSTLIVCVPLAWFFIKPHPPEHYGLIVDGEAPRSSVGEYVSRGENGHMENDFTAGQTLRMPSFWTLLAALTLNGGTLTMVTMHQMPYLEDIGVDTMAAAGVLGLMAILSLPGRPLLAWIANKWGERDALMLSFALKALGLLFLMLARSLTALTLFVVLFGIGYGGAIPLSASIRATYFGRRAYATISGITTLFTAITNVAYPIFAGWSHDVSGSYTTAFMLIAALQSLAIVFMFLSKKPHPPWKDPTPEAR